VRFYALTSSIHDKTYQHAASRLSPIRQAPLMCEPTTIMLGISAATAALSYKQASDSADRQTQAISDGVDLNHNQTRTQYEQNNQVAMQQQSERHREFLVDQGRLASILTESGMTGATQDRIQSEVENQADADTATIEANRVKANAQGASMAQAQHGQAKAQLASINRPSALGTGLQIAAAGAKAEAKSPGTFSRYAKKLSI
jgi:hypothetical protein